MSLQVWLPLNGNLNNYGCSDLTFSLVANNTAVNNSGKIGKCYANDSYTAGGILSNKTINLGKTQSLFCWFKFTSLMSNSSLGGAMGGQHRYPSNTGLGLTIKYVSSTTGYISVNTGNGSSRTYNTYCGTTLLQANTWYHGGYTYDGTTLKIYLNGVCEYTGTFTDFSVPADYIYAFAWSFNASSGSALHANYKLLGSMNDFRAYDHVLSIKEIRELAKGLVLHYALDNNGYGMANYFLNSNFATGTTANWGGVNSSSISIATKDGRKCLTGTKGTSNYLVCQVLSGYSYTANSQINFTISADVYVEATGTITIGNWISTTQASGWQGMSFSETWHTSNSLQVGWNHVSVTHVNTKNQYSGSIITAFAYSAATFWITNLKFEFCDIDTPWIPNSADSNYAVFNINGTRESDLTGYGRHGTLVSAMPTIDSDTARYSCCYKYAGSTNNVHYNNTTDFNYTDNFSFACWIKTNYTGTTAQYAWTVGRADAGGYGYGIQCTSTTNCNVRFGNKSYGVAVTGGQWTHLAFTKSGTAIKIYKNGAVASNITFDGTLPTYSDGAGVGIGCFHYASGNIYPFYGNLSDFRIYATALSADDILELYRANAEIDTNGRIYSSDFTEV